MNQFLKDILNQLIREADQQIKGKNKGMDRERWIAERIYGYVEAQDVAFARTIVQMARLPIPGEILERVLDNPRADGIQKIVVMLSIRTLIKKAYSARVIQEAITQEELTPDEVQSWEKARDALLKDGDTPDEKQGQEGDGDKSPLERLQDLKKPDTN